MDTGIGCFFDSLEIFRGIIFFPKLRIGLIPSLLGKIRIKENPILLFCKIESASSYQNYNLKINYESF